jgi:hypothetical protein
LNQAHESVDFPLNIAANIQFFLTSRTSFAILGMEVTMRKIAALSLVLVLVSSASAQSWFKGTLDEAIAKSKTENKKVLINFFSGG